MKISSTTFTHLTSIMYILFDRMILPFPTNNSDNDGLSHRRIFADAVEAICKSVIFNVPLADGLSDGSIITYMVIGGALSVENLNHIDWHVQQQNDSYIAKITDWLKKIRPRRVGKGRVMVCMMYGDMGRNKEVNYTSTILCSCCKGYP